MFADRLIVGFVLLSFVLLRGWLCTQALAAGVICGLALHAFNPLVLVGVYGVMGGVVVTITVQQCTISQNCWTRWHALAGSFMPSSSKQIHQLRDIWNAYLQVRLLACC